MILMMILTIIINSPILMERRSSNKLSSGQSLILMIMITIRIIDTFGTALHSSHKVQLWTKLVSWCCKPSQPQRIISWLRETFMKTYIYIYIVEKTNKAE